MTSLIRSCHTPWTSLDHIREPDSGIVTDCLTNSQQWNSLSPSRYSPGTDRTKPPTREAKRIHSGWVRCELPSGGIAHVHLSGECWQKPAHASLHVLTTLSWNGSIMKPIFIYREGLNLTMSILPIYYHLLFWHSVCSTPIEVLRHATISQFAV